MPTFRKPILTVLQWAVVTLGATLATALLVASQMGGGPDQAAAYIQWGNRPDMTPGWVARAAQYDFVALAPGGWAGRDSTITELRRANLDIMVGQYWQMHTLPAWLASGAVGSYPRRLWDAGAGYLATAADGTPAAIWGTQPVYDVFNPECRAAMITVLKTEVRAHGLDWLFLDYCSPTLGGGQPGVDFDNNGVDLRTDKAEQAALVAVWHDYVAELREALPGVLLIANGSLALRSDTFAALCDGAWVEHFPQWFFGSVGPNLAGAMDPDFPYNLEYLTGNRWARSPGYVMLGSPTGFDWDHVAERFPGCLTGWNMNGDWPPDRGL